MQLLLRWRVLLTGKPDLGHTHMAFWFPCMALQAECKSCWGSNPSCWIAASVSQGPDTANQSDILPLGSREKDLCQAPQMQFASVFWLVCAGHDISWGYGSPAPLLSETKLLVRAVFKHWQLHPGEQPCGMPVSTAAEASLLPLSLYLSSRIALLYLFLPRTTFKLPWRWFQVGGAVAKGAALI